MNCPLCGRKSQKPLRSLNQNALYWLFLSVIERDTGNNARTMHDYLRATLLPPKHIVIRGKNAQHEVEVPYSTTELTKNEFSDYITKIEAHVGMACPDPHDLEGYYCGKKNCPRCV